MSFTACHLLIVIIIKIGGVSFLLRITDFGRQQWFTVHIRWDRIDKIRRMRTLWRSRICLTSLSDGSVLVISPVNSRTD